MCRHLAHVGVAPVTLASLVTEPTHSLLVQAHAPRDMRGGGTVNADGFGAGWWAAEPHARSSVGQGPRNCTPTVYRRDDPMWTDPSFLDLAGSITTTALVAAVRSATVGMPVSTAACAPFADPDAGALFSHNGVVRGWPHSMTELAAELPIVDLLTLDAATDSALLWALVRHRCRAGKDPADAVADVAVAALAAAPGSRLNLLWSDGQRIVATAVDHALSVRTGPAGVTVASEPLDDDPGWRAVGDRSLLTVDGPDREPVVRPLP